MSNFNHLFFKKRNIPEKLRKIEQSAWGFFIQNFRITILFIVAIILWGTFSLISIPLESDPEVKVPIAVVTTAYPGASPTDIEELVTDKLESQLNKLENLDKLESTSSEGISSITVHFDAKADLDESFRDLRDEVEKVNDLPDEAEDPIVTEISLSDRPIVTFSLIGNYPEEQFKTFAENIQDELERIPGVSEVIISGIRDTEFQILVNATKLKSYQLEINDVIQAIRSNNLNTPIGSITTDNLNYQVRLKGELKEKEQFKNLPIKAVSDGYIYLKDVASTQEIFSDRSNYARVSIRGAPPESTASLTVYKKTGGNVIEVVDTAKELIKNLQTPEDLKILVTNDNSEFIRDDLYTLVRSGIQTIILIAIILFLALGVKEALIAACSIPLIFAIAIGVLNYYGLTLNGVTLFSLVLSLGLMVDTSIVIMEGFHENFFIKKMDAYTAALESVRMYRWPLVSGTLTTVSAFVPMFLVGGIMGEFMKYIPWTVTITLLASLLFAVTINPSIAARIFPEKSRKKADQKRKTSKKVAFYEKAVSKYQEMLRNLITSRKRRWQVVGIAFLAFITSTALPITGILGAQAFPAVNVNFFNLSIEAPVGTRLEKTNEIVKEVEEILSKEEVIDNYVVTVGSRSSFRRIGGGSTSNSHIAGVSVNLIKKENREETSTEIASKLRPKLKAITSAEVKIDEIHGGPPTGAPVEIRITGPEIGGLEKIALRIKNELRNIPGAVEVVDDIEHGTGEFTFTVNRDKLNYYGISVSEISSTLRSAVFGVKASEVRKEGDDIEIRVSYDWRAGKEKMANRPDYLTEIKGIELLARSGEYIPLKAVADVSLGASYVGIRHFDTDRIMRVQSQTEGRSANEIVEDLQKALAGYQLPKNYQIVYGGETEATTESFMDLYYSLIIGLVLIAFILVLQFDSFIQPFIILLTLPLSLIGVFPGLLIMGLYLSLPAFIGVVSLAGIVVNDAIVLIDRINQNRKEGLEIFDAIVESGRARMQPIFITSITTVFGLLPLSLSDEVWGGLGFSIIFGISFSTILTLIVVPVLYTMMELRGEKKRAVEVIAHTPPANSSERSPGTSPLS